MALLACHASLTAERYCRVTAAFVDWLVAQVEQKEIAGRRGWHAHLSAYRWNDREWRETLDLREAQKPGVAAGDRDAVRAVLAWGHMRDMSEAAITETPPRSRPSTPLMPATGRASRT